MKLLGSRFAWTKIFHVITSAPLSRMEKLIKGATNSDLFQPNTEISVGCPNDAAMYKPVEKSHPGFSEDIT